MKKYYLLLLSCILTGFVMPLHASTPAAEVLGLRLSAKVSYEPVDHLQVFASEEFRFGGSDLLDCSYTEVGASYGALSFLKVGLSYTAILTMKGEAGLPLHAMQYKSDWRHRGTLDLTFSGKAGQWKFSLRERVQATYKMEQSNPYQQAPVTWVLRNRLKVAYKSQRFPLEPYVYIEPRLLLNGASWGKIATSTDYGHATFGGYKDVYFNRYRVAIGSDWQVSDKHSLDIYLLYDYLNDKSINAYKAGDVQEGMLKSPIHLQKKHYVALCVAYEFGL